VENSQWHEQTVGYHVAPRDRRGSIDADGLKAQQPPEPGCPKGVYLWESKDRARGEAPEGHDVYEVKLPIPRSYRDPNPSVQGATVYPGDVPPNMIRRLNEPLR
jgi:hypothetical protein